MLRRHHPGAEIGGNCQHTTAQPRKLAAGTRGWVITGGESGHGERLTHPAWVRLQRDQCVPAGIAFHHRQWGEWIKCDFAELPSSSSTPIIRNSALGCDNGYVSDISLEGGNPAQAKPLVSVFPAWSRRRK